MTLENGRIIIKDDNDNIIRFHTFDGLTAEKWVNSERADVIEFLEKWLRLGRIKHTTTIYSEEHISQEVAATAALLKSCMHEAKAIVDTELGGRNMEAHHRAERIESVGALIFFKHTEPPGSSPWMPADK